MKTNSSYKIKLLKIWEILNEATDEQNPLTTQQLIYELLKYGISCERRTLYRDIETLRQNGYNVMIGHTGHENTYYIDNRKFSMAEIKILMDAVQSSAFIPEAKTDQLIDKLAELGGIFCGYLLKRNTVHFKTVKHKNNEIYETIEAVETAMEKHTKLSFNYFRLNECGERVYSNEKSLYTEEPIGMVIENSNYYLLCYRPEPEYKHNIRTFRLDRICGACVMQQPICKEALSTQKKSMRYRMQIFKMYSGELQKVTLQFSSSLIGVMYDKFGTDITIQKNGERFRTTVEVQISPTFWGWLLQFPGDMKIVEPNYLNDDYCKWLDKARLNTKQKILAEKQG